MDLISVTRKRHGAVGHGIGPYVLHSCYAMILHLYFFPFKSTGRNREMSERFFVLSFVDGPFLYNLVNKSNLVHILFLVQLSISTCFGRLCPHHQEKQCVYATLGTCYSM